jgi:CubicO group peptidase (beta-lactamase class C family)
MGETESNRIVRDAVEATIRDRGEIGVQVAAYVEGRKFVDVAAGVADLETGRLVDSGTLFNIWSISKAVVATALHIQAERGLIDYDAPVARYWPEFAANGKDGITVRHVLMHRSGAPQMPEGSTPERICDWEWMVRGLAALKPLAGPGERPMYQALSFGWLVGELVRRTDPKHRQINTFLQEEINGPLGIEDLWLGVPNDRLPRIARMIDEFPQVPEDKMPPIYAAAAPYRVRLKAEVFEDDLIRTSQIPGVGGIATANSVARLFAMLAGGGELDGVRLLSPERVAKFNTPRIGSDEADLVMFGQIMPLSTSGYWLPSNTCGTHAMGDTRSFGHPGVGGTIAWADPDQKLAVAICHNRLRYARTPEEDPLMPIADAVRQALTVTAAGEVA